MIWLIMMWLLACTAGGFADNPSCDTDLFYVFPDGSKSRIDFCTAFDITAEYEFDPDDPPEVRNVSLWLDATIDEGFECWVMITERSACGEGSYQVDGETTDITVDTSDCDDVPDDYEGMGHAVKGEVTFDLLDAGSEPGNFTGKPLTTRVSGTLNVSDSVGTVLAGSFDVTYDVTAADAEEDDCTPVE